MGFSSFCWQYLVLIVEEEVAGADPRAAGPVVPEEEDGVDHEVDPVVIVNLVTISLVLANQVQMVSHQLGVREEYPEIFSKLEL